MNDEITLSAYAEETRSLIHNDRNDEALTLCRHILRYYPKHVDTYRQMAKASLEKGDLDGAQDLFRRVLSADPENVVAYAGLAIVFEQQHLRDEALWHLERAYELAPANPEIRKELLHLYAQVDGKPRARIKLTPGALARLYVQEGLFSQAIQEFRAIASSAPTRFDARVALAETLWHAGRVREAADTAQSLLDPLPYCLKANLILGTIWHESGLKESETYLRRAQAIDPMNQIAQQLLGARSPLRLTQVLVPRYVEGAQPTAMPELAADLVLEHFPETAWFTPAPLASEKPSIEAPPSAPAEEVAPVTQTPAIEMPPPAPIEAAPFAEAEAAKVEPPPPALTAAAKPTPQVSGAPRVAQPTTKPIVKPTVAIPSSLPPWLTEFQTTIPRKTETAEEKIESPTSMPPLLAEEPKTEKGELPPETPLVPATEEGPAWLHAAPSSQAAGLATTSESELTPGEVSAPAWATLAPATEPRPEPSAETHEASELPDWLRETPTQPMPPAPTVVSPEKSATTETYIEPELETESPFRIAQAPQEESAPLGAPLELEPFETLQEPVTAVTPVSTLAPVESAPTETPAEPAPEIGAAAQLITPLAPVSTSAPVESVPTEAQPEPEAAALQLIAPVPPVSAPAASAPVESGPPIVGEIPSPEEPQPVSPAPEPTHHPEGYTQLIQARAHRDANRLADALAEYDYIVQHAPHLVNDVINDLQALIQRAGVPLHAHRILGDAYSRANRLAEALERYRFVLDRVP